MKPVVTVEEMYAADAASGVASETLIARAGWQVARQAQRMMGGSYGRRVAVVAGPGNNGNDGRLAAQYLADWGAKVCVVAPGDSVPSSDLVIDAAYGAGFRGSYEAPDVGEARVLSVDLPTGLFGDTGESVPRPVRAEATVTFSAYKPAHFLKSGPDLCGELVFADIGIDAQQARMWFVEDEDARSWLPVRARHAHKWNAALSVVAGSPGMWGSAQLVCRGAMRAGAGMVHHVAVDAPEGMGEVVRIETTAEALADAALRDSERTDGMVVGPGFGRGVERESALRTIVAEADVPVVIDGDALYAFRDVAQYASLFARRTAPTVLTPHWGEFLRLGIEGDTLSSLREMAALTRAIVVLKGPTTLIAAPDGTLRVVQSGDPRLATAGTGDVLVGIIGAFLAQGVAEFDAASLGAHSHGAAAKAGHTRGFIASDLPELVADWMSEK